MADNFVDALSPFWILLIGRHEARADTFLARFLGFATIVSAIDTAGRNRDVHPLRVRRVRKNRVQAKSAAARLPLGAMWMIEEASIQRPILATVRRFEKRGGLNAAIERIRIVRIA